MISWHAERPRPLLGGGGGGGGGRGGPGRRGEQLDPLRRNAYGAALRGCFALMRHFKDHVGIGDMLNYLLGKCGSEKEGRKGKRLREGGGVEGSGN